AAINPTGRFAVWENRQPGLDAQVWHLDLVSGARRKLGWDDHRTYTHALVSADGTLAAYRISEPVHQPIYVQDANGGPAKLVCQDCGTPSDWAANSNRIFYVTGDQPAAIGSLHLTSGKHDYVLKHPSYNLWGARVWLNASGDGWLAFYVDNGSRT